MSASVLSRPLPAAARRCKWWILPLSAMMLKLPGQEASAAGVPDVSLEYPPGTAWAPSGTVLAWKTSSESDYGQSAVPEEANSGVTDIAAGWFHTVAVKNGRVLAWGRNDYGQVTVPSAAQAGISGISAGGNHVLAVTGSGSVIAWGSNVYGQVNVPASASSGVIAVAAGGNHSLALKADGRVIAWGRNSYGQTDVPAAAQTGVTALSAGIYHSAALKTGGTVIAWGRNSDGQTDVPAAARQNIKFVAAGGSCTWAIDFQGKLIPWGAPEFTPSPLPGQFKNLLTVAPAHEFVTGVRYSLGLRSDGGVVATENALFGIGVPQSRSIAIAVGRTHAVALTGPTIRFGEQATAVSSAKSLLLRNTGSDGLSVSGVVLYSGDTQDFSLDTAGITEPIPPSGQTTFSVSFTPVSPGLKSAMIRVLSNDPDEQIMCIAVTGTALTPLENWRLTHFGQSANTGLAANDADPNGNHIPNLLEYALGGAPASNTADTSVLPRILPASGRRAQLAFTRHTNRTDLTLTVQASDSTAGPWENLARSISGEAFSVLTPGSEVSETGDGATIAVTVSDVYDFPAPAHPRRFLRLKAEVP